jgi:hypothetical protein
MVMRLAIERNCILSGDRGSGLVQFTLLLMNGLSRRGRRRRLLMMVMVMEKMETTRR